MQLIERPPPRDHIVESGTRRCTSLRATTLTALCQRHGSGYSREFIRESVISWATRKWPELLVGRDACAIAFAARSDSASVQVTFAGDGDGEYVWAFKGTGPDSSGRVWETCVLVLSAEDHDILAVRTGYTGDDGATPFCAQPRFLCSVVEHLPFDDGGHPLSTQPRQVLSLTAFADFRDHLFSRSRTLPILAVASRDKPEGDVATAPSPVVLARALCGVAHVVSLSGVSISCLEECFGSGMALHAGEARLFMPGLAADPDPEQHPAFTQTHAAQRLEASYIEAAAQHATHSWSTSAARRADFDALWARSGRL